MLALRKRPAARNLETHDVCSQSEQNDMTQNKKTASSSDSTTASPHRAKYLVLLGPDNAPRALLFSGTHHYMTELFDEDGWTLDHLIRHGAALHQPPNGLDLEEVLPATARVAHQPVRFFDLGRGTAAM